MSAGFLFQFGTTEVHGYRVFILLVIALLPTALSLLLNGGVTKHEGRWTA